MLDSQPPRKSRVVQGRKVAKGKAPQTGSSKRGPAARGPFEPIGSGSFLEVIDLDAYLVSVTFFRMSMA